MNGVVFYIVSMFLALQAVVYIEKSSNDTQQKIELNQKKYICREIK